MIRLAAALVLAATAALDGPTVLLVDEGSTHWLKAEAVPRSGWIGLFEEGDHARLKPATAIVTSPKGRDDDPVEIRSQPFGAFFLFRSVGAIEPGRVEWATSSNDEGLLEPGKPVEYRLGKRTYLLTLAARGPAMVDATVTLTSGGRSQVLYRQEGGGDEPHFGILFAGDLDRDGELDLIATFSPKYSWYPRTLYLSSQAREGELMHAVVTTDDFSC